MTGPCPRPECGGATHTDGWGNPTRCPHSEATAAEPKHLSREELEPLAAAIYQREAAASAGASLILPPLPPCPACTQPPAVLATQDAQPISDQVLIAFQPCGHVFTATGEDVYDTWALAQQQVGAPLPDITGPDQPPRATPLEEAQATVESLRYQIRRAREALATDEPVDRCPSCEHQWDIHADDGCWHTVTHGRPERDLVCACRVPRKEKP
ncbi:hypothetical protein [Streptomyces sp. 1222.5]|uniref:hypothetical protein n=1 Tax=Streptomyces sp. 1222.5 TaxID=1881026 RepID=UPI003EC0636F